MGIEIPEPALTITSFPDIDADGKWLVRIELWGRVLYEESVAEASPYAWPLVEGKVKREFVGKLRKLLESA